MHRFLFMLFVFAACTLHAETYVWQGPATGGDWNSPGNWSPSTGVPTGGDTAKFTAATTIASNFSTGSDAEKALTIFVQPASGVAAQTVTLSGVISGAGGLVAQPMTVDSNRHILYLSGISSTFTGPVTANGTGTLKVERIWNAGTVSSLGTGNLVTVNNAEQIFHVNNICHTDRKFVLTACRQINVTSGKTFNLNGELEATKILARELGELSISSLLTTAVTSIGRTDDGTLTILNDANTYTTIPSVPRGSLVFNTAAASGVASSAGTASKFVVGATDQSAAAGIYFNKSNDKDSTTTRWFQFHYANGATRTLGNLGKDTKLTIAADVQIAEVVNTAIFNVQADGEMEIGTSSSGGFTQPSGVNSLANLELHKKGAGECTQWGQLWRVTKPMYIEEGRYNAMRQLGRVEPIYVSAGAVLGGNGNVESAAKIAAGAAIAAGTSKAIGTLNVVQVESYKPQIDFADGAEILVKVDSAGNCDVINATGRPVNLAGKVKVRFSMVDGSRMRAGTYEFLKFGSITAGTTSASFEVVGNPGRRVVGTVTVGANSLSATVSAPGLILVVK